MSTILIVEDEEPLREFIDLLMRDAGHRTVLAIHGREALELVAHEPPDLVISDVMMPLMNGVELCRELKANAGTAGIPVLLMSAAGKQVAAGAAYDAFIGKPFDLDAMESLVERLLAGTGSAQPAAPRS